MPPPPPEPRVASIEPQHETTSFDIMDQTTIACFSYGWDVTESSRIGMLYLNDSLNRLQLRTQELRAPFEPIPILDEFINYLQWPTSKSFYFEWGVVMLVGMEQ